MARRQPLDASTYAEFVAARSASMFRTAYLVIGDYQLAEDLLQESLVKVYVAWPRLREPGNAEAYTRRVIVTTAISWRRRRSFHEPPTGELPERVAADQTERITARDELWNQLAPVASAATSRGRAALLRGPVRGTDRRTDGLLGRDRQTTGLDRPGQAARTHGRRPRPSHARPLGGDPMNTFHDLARRVSDVTAPPVDVDGLIAQGEKRLHRRRVRAVLAGVAVVTIIAAGGYVADSAQQRSNGPVDKPNEPERQHQVSGSVTRKIVYKDGFSGSAVHFDDRLVETNSGWLENGRDRRRVRLHHGVGHEVVGLQRRRTGVVQRRRNAPRSAGPVRARWDLTTRRY